MRGCLHAENEDLTSSRWVRKLTLITRELASQDSARALELTFRKELAHLALADVSRNPRELCENIDKRLTELQNAIDKALRPWLKPKRPASKAWLKKALDDWQSIWGDLDSPETQEKIRKTVEAMKSRRKGS